MDSEAWFLEFAENVHTYFQIFPRFAGSHVCSPIVDCLSHLRNCFPPGSAGNRQAVQGSSEGLVRVRGEPYICAGHSAKIYSKLEKT